jgi:hypothetical protein
VICRYCGGDFPETMFEVANVIKGVTYRRRKCVACKRLRTNARRDTIREWFREYKQSQVCAHCGFADYRAITFHHTDPAGKEFEVSSMVSIGSSIARIQAELAKCIPLCANCHMILHYDEQESL